MPDNPVFVNPNSFQPGQIIVMLCNDFQGSLGWFIKWFCKGNYCHAAIIRRPGFVCSQNDLYKEIPLTNYMKPSEGLKFWVINNLTIAEFKIINDAITADLAKPWWNRFYNYLGLIGQGLHLPWISMPGQDICSQRVAEYLRMLPRLLAIVPEHPSPSDLDNIFNANLSLMTVLGYWWED